MLPSGFTRWVNSLIPRLSNTAQRTFYHHCSLQNFGVCYRTANTKTLDYFRKENKAKWDSKFDTYTEENGFQNIFSDCLPHLLRVKTYLPVSIATRSVASSCWELLFVGHKYAQQKIVPHKRKLCMTPSWLLLTHTEIKQDNMMSKMPRASAVILFSNYGEFIHLYRPVSPAALVLWPKSRIIM